MQIEKRQQASAGFVGLTVRGTPPSDRREGWGSPAWRGAPSRLLPRKTDGKVHLLLDRGSNRCFRAEVEFHIPFLIQLHRLRQVDH